MPTIVDAESRITARVPAELRDTLEQGARLQGATLNQFVVQSASQEAQQVVEPETVIMKLLPVTLASAFPEATKQ